MATLQGSAEVAAALRALPLEVAKTALRKSAIAGARVVRDQVRAQAPISSGLRRRSSGRLVPPGTLRRAIVLKFAKEKSSVDAATYIVAVRRGKNEQKNNRDAFYFYWVEQGHRIVGKSKKVFGHVPPHPFFVPAYRATSAKARETMKSVLEAETGQAVRLIAAKGS